MSVSQEMISQRVGVSRTAVSHVLNGRGHMVSNETRQRILQEVEVSGYHRNALVRALRANRTHVVGIVVSDAALSFFSLMIQAAEREANARGLQCFLCQSRSRPEGLVKEVSALREYRVDGILIVPSSSTATPQVYQDLLKHKCPFVLVDVPAHGMDVPFVGNDNVEAGRRATEHLISLGHRRIACVRGFHENPAALERVEGYRLALKKARIPFDETLVTGDGFKFEAGHEAITALLARKIDFTGVAAASDYVALGAIRALTEAGLSVPGDISVVGCGNLESSAMVSPALTTVDQHADTLGYLAMDLLIKQIEGKSKVIQKIIVKPDLVVRQSTKAVSKH